MQSADHDVVRLDARRSNALLARDGLQGALLGSSVTAVCQDKDKEREKLG